MPVLFRKNSYIKKCKFNICFYQKLVQPENIRVAIEYTAEKMKFSIKGLFSKCDQIPVNDILTRLLKLMEGEAQAQGRKIPILGLISNFF